jgi:NADPH:quinone reductase
VKAWRSHRPGPPSSLVLEDLPLPAPGPGELRIRVHASGVNFPDLLMIDDRYQVRPPRPFTPGAEVAGVVDAAGEGVDASRIGERVMAVCTTGGLAEAIVMPAERCVPLPDGLSMDEAASLQLTYGTAWFGLVERGLLAAGEVLLVTGAAGGVGLAAVEIGRARGARVVAAVSSEEKAAAARAGGADAAVLYPRGPLDGAAIRELATQLRKACGRGADVVLDPVGGDYAEAALRALNPRGRLVIAGFTAGIPLLPANLVLLKDATVLGAPWGAVVATDPAGYRRCVDALLALHAAGRIRPRVQQRIAFADAPQALERLLRREAVGKLVVVRAEPVASP